ncbi:EF-hand, partial [Ascoidea rubescens DSM 1968]
QQLIGIFQYVDKDRSGYLSARELSDALFNHDGTRFEPSTIRLMVKLFDKDNSNSLDFKEFYFLNRYLIYWRKTFHEMDADRSGTITYDEYLVTLQKFQFNLSPNLSQFLFNRFAKVDFNPYGGNAFDPWGSPSGTIDPQKNMKFGHFIESLIWLLRFTNLFRAYDKRGNGVAQFNFEDFIYE